MEVQGRGDEVWQAVGVAGVAWGQDDVGEVQQLSHQYGGHHYHTPVSSAHCLNQHLSQAKAEHKTLAHVYACGGITDGQLYVDYTSLIEMFGGDDPELRGRGRHMY